MGKMTAVSLTTLLLLAFSAPGSAAHPNPGIDKLPAPQGGGECSFSIPGPAKEGISWAKVKDDLWVEKLQGVEALAHLNNLMSRHPGAFAKARASLSKRGFKPTDRVLVERTVRLAMLGSSTIAPAQDYSEQNSDGEIVFWSWSDGNDGTWEGSIYVEVYSTGAASTWEGQIDSSTTSYPWIYYDETWEKPGGGGGGIIKQTSQPGGPGNSLVIPAVEYQGSQLRPPVFLPASFLGWARCWRAAVITGCTAAASGCLFSDGGWPACFAGWCLGTEVGSAIGCWLLQ